MSIDKRDVTTVGDEVQLTTIHKTRSDFSVIELQINHKNMNTECTVLLYCTVIMCYTLFS